jgi:hypothetical protein
MLNGVATSKNTFSSTTAVKTQRLIIKHNKHFSDILVGFTSIQTFYMNTAYCIDERHTLFHGLIKRSV